MDKDLESYIESSERPEGAPPYDSSTTGSARALTPDSTVSGISVPNTELELDTNNHAAVSANYRPFRTSFASIKLMLNDTLVLQRFPLEVVALVRSTIQKHWPKGIQKEDYVDRSDADNTGRTFKLKGNPWLVLPQNTVAVGDSVMACRLVTALLDALSKIGWVLTLKTGSAIGMPQHKPTLIFRYQDPPPAAVNWTVLAVMHVGTMDTLRVIDGPAELRHDLTETLDNAGMTRRYGRSFEGVYDIELGRLRCTIDNVDMQEFMLLIMEVLDRHGYTVAASLDQFWDHGKPDVWYISAPKGWQSGMPVFHR